MADDFVVFDLCDEDRDLRKKFLKLFYLKRTGDFLHFNAFVFAAEIEKMNPNSFYSNMGFAIARSWQLSPVLIVLQRMKVRELIAKAEDLIANDPIKKRWFKRSMNLIRKNFKRNNIPYEY